MASNEVVKPLGHTFHIIKNNAGWFGLGARVQVIEDGQVTGEATVYGDTLHHIKLHMDAEATFVASLTGLHSLAPGASLELPITVLEMDKKIAIDTNNRLPKNLQRPHPSE